VSPFPPALVTGAVGKQQGATFAVAAYRIAVAGHDPTMGRALGRRYLANQPQMARQPPVVLLGDDLGHDPFQLRRLGLIGLKPGELTQRQTTATTVATAQPPPAEPYRPDARTQPPLRSILQLVARSLAAGLWPPGTAADYLSAEPGVYQLQPQAHKTGHPVTLKEQLGLDHQLIHRETVFR